MKRFVGRRLSIWEAGVLGLIVLAGAGLVAELMLLGDLEPSFQTQPETQTQPEPAPLTLVQRGTREVYSAVAARPLFTVDRKPYEVPVEEPEPPPVVRRERRPEPEVTFELSAVIRTPATNIALLSVTGKPEIHRLRPGDTLEGWHLRQVDAGSVQLTRDGREIQVQIDPEEETRP